MSIVTEYLDALGVGYELLEHGRSFTGADEARALGMDPDEVVKTIILDADGGHILAVVPASRRLDVRRLTEAIGKSHVALATEREIARDFPGFEPGALPPLPGLLETDAFVDSHVRDRNTVVFAAGRQTESLRVKAGDLLAAERVHVLPIVEG